MRAESEGLWQTGAENHLVQGRRARGQELRLRVGLRPRKRVVHPPDR